MEKGDLVVCIKDLTYSQGMSSFSTLTSTFTAGKQYAIKQLGNGGNCYYIQAESDKVGCWFYLDNTMNGAVKIFSDWFMTQEEWRDSKLSYLLN